MRTLAARGWNPPGIRATVHPSWARRSIRGLIALLALAALPAAAHAQDIGVRAFLGANQVGVGRQFVLNVEVTGTQQVDGQPELPVMDDFADYLGSGSSSSFQMVNGRTTVSVTYQYRFLALAEGTFEIGPVSVSVGGVSRQTEPVSLVVSDAPPPPGAGAGAGDPADGIGPDDLFVETTVSKTRTFENDPVTVEYRIFTRVNVDSYSITTLPQAAGFWTEELEQPEAPQVERVVRDGVEYLTATIRRVALFPTGAGSRTLDPLTIEAQVRVPDRTPTGLDPFGDFFGRSSLFDRRVPVAAASQPVTIEVLRPPAEGRPASFSGHVGTLDIATSTDRAEVAVNEAVTFRVDFTGTGNLRVLPPPEVTFPVEFEAFPPETRDRIAVSGGNLSGTRGYDYVLIPRVPGSLTIPAVEISYFDAATGAYRTERSQPLEVTVTGDAAGADVPGAVPSAVESLREEIRFIHTEPPAFRRTDIPLHRTAGFWVILLLPVAALGGATVLRRHRDRIEGDVAYARVRRAGRMARKRLARARSLASGDPRAFYAEVAGALEGLLADRLNIAEAGLVREDAGRLAAERGVSQATLDRLFACLDDCDRQRFAPRGTEREAPERVLERAAALMGDLAKELSS
ncbi:MAG: protein BatD [Gemmatimonadetes bacterium]|nr:protein BatD [Gemmatimonadota bacterium]